MSGSPPDTPSKQQLRQRRREEMEQLFLVLLKRQQMQEVVRMMGSEFSCPVCQGLVSMATLANCGHMFCYKCIRTWCVDYARRNCPVCRVQIVARIRALPVDRFVRKCLEEAGEHELLKELLASEAAATAEEKSAAVFETDRAQVRATAATFYGGNPANTAGTGLTVRATGAASTGASWVASFGVSTD